MELLVDREISGAAQQFAAFGTVRLFDGRALSVGDLGAAEVLLVRSVTRVDAALLGNSAIRFVGTSTAGTDHIDCAWLAEQGIACAAAPGCNARAVAEHVICCMAEYAAERACALSDLRVGIIGYGHVGQALGALLERFGLSFVANDPPRALTVGGMSGVSLATALACDVVSLHVPLTDSGRHATRGLLGHDEIAALGANSLLINAARGGVVNEATLLARLAGAHAPYVAIDCWDGEPLIDPALLARAWRATTHIAGHTREARASASRMLQIALADFLGVAVGAAPAGAAREPLLPRTDSLEAVLGAAYPLATHTRRLREQTKGTAAARRQAFDALRRRYGMRREFAGHSVACNGLDNDTVAQLKALGFALH